MELKKQPKFASDFWPGFIKSSRIILILSQVLVFILIAVTLITTGIATINLWLILATISIFNTTILLLFVNKITKPTKKLLAAIIKVNDERPTLPVSSPNSEDDDET